MRLCLNRKSEIHPSFPVSAWQELEPKHKLRHRERLLALPVSCCILCHGKWKLLPCSKDFVGAHGDVQEIFLMRKLGKARFP